MVTGMALVDAIRNEEADPPSGIATLGLGGTHHWLTTMEPGRAVMTWPVDDRYLNLEEAVICTWIACLGDQAMFFAASSVCLAGEGTRMATFGTTLIANVTSGDELVVDARVVRRVDDRLHLTCVFSVADEPVAEMTAVIDVVPGSH